MLTNKQIKAMVPGGVGYWFEGLICGSAVVVFALLFYLDPLKVTGAGVCFIGFSIILTAMNSFRANVKHHRNALRVANGLAVPAFSGWSTLYTVVAIFLALLGTVMWAWGVNVERY